MFPVSRPITGVLHQTGSPSSRPPRIVAIGGGTGLPNVLRGLRPLLYGGNGRAEGTPSRDQLVAIVATSDDGGSSGRLRAQFNVIPPGDIRNCLAALSDNHALIADIFQYRFDGGDGLEGHPIGNLVLTALADVTHDFAKAVEIAARVVGARGTVLPATREMVTLVAEFDDGRIVSGETAISSAGGRIRQLSLIPDRPACLPGSCEALLEADVIVAGPGSLYTSILPPLLVPELRDALHRTKATRLFVANLMTEPGETDDYSALDEILALERHLDAQLFDCVIYNTSPVAPRVAEQYAAQGARPVLTGHFELAALQRLGIQPIGLPLVSEHPVGKIRHHPDRLAAAILAIAQRKLGAWRGRIEAGGI
ncbi:hypothetical protein BH24ACI5_BH24ACI5_08960 [soil metagenome]